MKTMDSSIQQILCEYWEGTSGGKAGRMGKGNALKRPMTISSFVQNRIRWVSENGTRNSL